MLLYLELVHGAPEVWSVQWWPCECLDLKVSLRWLVIWADFTRVPTSNKRISAMMKLVRRTRLILLWCSKFSNVSSGNEKDSSAEAVKVRAGGFLGALAQIWNAGEERNISKPV